MFQLVCLMCEFRPFIIWKPRNSTKGRHYISHCVLKETFSLNERNPVYDASIYLINREFPSYRKECWHIFYSKKQSAKITKSFYWFVRFAIVLPVNYMLEGTSVYAVPVSSLDLTRPKEIYQYLLPYFLSL